MGDTIDDGLANLKFHPEHIPYYSVAHNYISSKNKIFVFKIV